MEKENRQIESWKDYLGEYYDAPSLYKTIPDFIVADINNLQEVDNTTLRKGVEPQTFPMSLEDSLNASRLKMKFQNDEKYFSMSAPTIGIPKQIMVHYWPPPLKKIKKKHKDTVLTWFNPSYEPTEDDMYIDYEKCPSVKKLCGMVNRYKHIKVKYYDLDGEFFESVYHGLRARIIQHEIDHMHGLLFIDHAVKIITKKEHRFNRKNGMLETYYGHPLHD